MKKDKLNSYINQSDIDFSFDDISYKIDYDKYEKIKTKHRKLKILIPTLVGCSLLVAIAAPTIAYLTQVFETTSSVKQYKKEYSINEVNLIESSSFKKLNEVNYPAKSVELKSVNQEYVDAINNFSYNIYSNYENKTNNFSFAPFSLYSNLSILSMASDNEQTISSFDNVLGLDRQKRKENYLNAYQTDYFCDDDGTIQMYNGLFLNSYFGNANLEFVNEITSLYTEAYQLDFANNSATNKMLEWVDEKINEKNFISKESLELKPTKTAFYLFSTMFFDNKWANTYKESDTKTNIFYLENNEKIDVKFMKHTYYGDCYDYENYISCYDYYQNGIKIKYLIPKNDVKENIFEITKGINILEDNEENKIKSVDEYGMEKSLIVNLSLPKFESKPDGMIDFSSTLKKIGLIYAFDEYSHSFDYVYEDLDANISTYLDFVKQKNFISFTEDGTTIKSVTVSAVEGLATMAPPMYDIIDVNLNRPFIYVIYDANNIPLYIGNVNNPTLN